MSDTMKELLVKQRDNVTNKVLGYALLGLAVIGLFATIFVSPVFIIILVGAPLLAYFIYFRRMSVEYEYTYLDKEIRIDRIYNLNNRKNVDTIDLSKMEILAVSGSSSLDSFKRRQAKVSDYSAGEDTEETKVYELWYEGQRKILISLNDDFLTPIVRLYANKVKKN